MDYLPSSGKLRESLTPNSQEYLEFQRQLQLLALSLQERFPNLSTPLVEFIQDIPNITLDEYEEIKKTLSRNF